MNPRRLTSEEEIILDAIIAQRGGAWGDIFEYDMKKTQEYFAKTGIFAKYKLSYYEQAKIIMKLSDDGIIDIDYIVSVEFTNNCRTTFEPNLPLIETDRPFFWAKQKDWAYETYQLKGLISIEYCYKQLHGIPMRMTRNDIDYINSAYRVSHTIQLKLDENHLCLSLKIDQEPWRRLPPLHDDKPPFQILRYAYNHHDKIIDRDELIKNGINVKGKYLRTQVFSDNNTVQALSPLLLKLEKDSIMFITDPVKLTLNELNKLKTKLKIF